jgi:hypothetical protein
MAGYGSKAAYRGDKLTKRVWQDVYGGQVQWTAARVYQGQTKNVRTAGGGFAPVYTLRDKDTRTEINMIDRQVEAGRACCADTYLPGH